MNTTTSQDSSWGVDLQPSIEGTIRAQYLALAAFVVLLYDHCLTWNEELQYFWSGSWTISRVFFFINRYYPPVVMIMTFYSINIQGQTSQFCERAVSASFILGVVGIVFVHVILVLRMWYIYAKSLFGRMLAVICFLASTVSTFSLLAVHIVDLKAWSVSDMSQSGSGVTFPAAVLACNVVPNHGNNLWMVLVPGLIVHTVLFIANSWPALKMRRMGELSPLTDRLFQDGGVFYVLVFSCMLFITVLGAQQTHLLVAVPALISNVASTLMSVATSRLLLSIQSLAANLSVNPNWLLSHAELSRLRWRKGAYEGELIIEFDNVEDAGEEYRSMTIMHKRMSGMESFPGGVYTSQVGVFDD